MGVYLKTYASGHLENVSRILDGMMENCALCPRKCRIDRMSGQTGQCGIGDACLVSSHLPHHGEEPPLSGTRGSGTIFFSGCNLDCRFCQNYQISHDLDGRQTTTDGLAGMMLDLQNRGCHNINLVSPSHVIPFIINALIPAVRQGLRIPLVYNSNGYDDVSVLAMLEGIIDIYLPDMKYAGTRPAAEWSGAEDYPAVAQKAILEMHRQTGRLRTDDNGLATGGLMIRHLVLPGGLAGSRDFLSFLAENGMQHIPLSLMSQYHPVHRAASHPLMGRTVTPAEYRQVLDWAEDRGFDRLLVQEMESHREFLPDFSDENPFGDQQ